MFFIISYPLICPLKKLKNQPRARLALALDTYSTLSGLPLRLAKLATQSYNLRLYCLGNNKGIITRFNSIFDVLANISWDFRTIRLIQSTSLQGIIFVYSTSKKLKY